MILPVQKFLLTHSFAELTAQHGVEISVDRRHGHKFSLNYSQFMSKNDDLLACGCRGLILSTGSSLKEKAQMIDGKLSFDHIIPGSTYVVAYPMTRFFNHGQGEAKIDWNDPTLQVLNKVDGTCCIVHFDQFIHEWHVATRSTPEADVSLEAGRDLTFRKLFERGLRATANLSFQEFTSKLDPNKTYCFELTSPYNTVVVQHQDISVTLLAIRNNLTHEEEIPELSQLTSWIPTVDSYSVKSVNDILEFVNQRNPSEFEGVVLRDSNFNRIKIKSTAYTAAHKAIDCIGRSPRSCIELVLSEKADDVLPLLPKLIADELVAMQERTATFFQKFAKQYNDVVEQTTRDLSDPQYAGWNEKKIFAKNVMANKDMWQGPAFAMRSNKVKSISDYIKNCQVMGSWPNPFLDTLLELTGYNREDKI